MHRKFFLFTLLILTTAAMATAETYKWRDADGALHFSDVPPSGAAAEKAVDLEPVREPTPETAEPAEVKPPVPPPTEPGEHALDGPPPDLVLFGGPMVLKASGAVILMAGQPPQLSPSTDAVMDKVQAKTGGAVPPAVIRLALSPNPAPTPSATVGDGSFFPPGDTLHLELVLAEGGFVRATTSTLLTVRKMLDRMEEAPTFGYQPRLRLRLHDNRDTYFFCKIGGYYGKGRLAAPHITDPDTIQSYIMIYMNPISGRDLSGRMW